MSHIPIHSYIHTQDTRHWYTNNIKTNRSRGSRQYAGIVRPKIDDELRSEGRFYTAQVRISSVVQVRKMETLPEPLVHWPVRKCTTPRSKRLHHQMKKH